MSDESRTTILPLRLHELTYAVNGRALVDRIELAIEAGTRTVILGPNGAGKSVFMRLCHGLIEATRGRVEWARAHARLEQAMVFQRPVMLRRSASANIDYALKLRGLDAAARKRRVDEALRMVGLEAIASRSARVLSGGEQQRLALARAWALRPQVLFLDEPTANLDPTATAQVEAIIDRIHGEGTKIVMSTHNLGQARRLADEILFLHEGRVVERAPVDAFFAEPRSEEARAFIGAELPWR